MDHCLVYCCAMVASDGGLAVRTCTLCDTECVQGTMTLGRRNAGAEHHLDSAIAAAELLDKCPGCAGVLQRGGRPRALVDAALAEQAARVAADDEDDDADDGGADGALLCESPQMPGSHSRYVRLYLS